MFAICPLFISHVKPVIYKGGAIISVQHQMGANKNSPALLDGSVCNF